MNRDQGLNRGDRRLPPLAGEAIGGCTPARQPRALLVGLDGVLDCRGIDARVDTGAQLLREGDCVRQG